jgi:hypothetical protein
MANKPTKKKKYEVAYWTIDPLTGKRKRIVVKDPEEKRKIEAQRKEERKQRREEQRKTAAKVQKQRLKKLRELNPNIYEDKTISQKTGKIISKEKAEQEFKEAIQKAADDKKLTQGEKKYKLAFEAMKVSYNKSNGYAKQAISDMNFFANELNKILMQLPNKLYEKVMQVLGQRRRSNNYEYDEFISYNYEEETKPKMAQEIISIKEQAKLALSVITIEASRTRSDNQRQLIYKFIHQLEDLISAIDNSATLKNARANFFERIREDVPEPVFKGDLRKSGIMPNKK